MCVTSLVVDSWRQPGPNQLQWPVVQRDPVLAAQMLQLIATLEAIDKRLGAIECKVEARAKRNIKRRLKRAASKEAGR